MADVGITPFLTGPKGTYAATNPPAYMVVLREASHFAWVNCGRQKTTESCLGEIPNERLLTDYRIAFFDRYLKGVPAPVLDEKEEGLAKYDVRMPHQKP
jgi:hypothetical protein